MSHSRLVGGLGALAALLMLVVTPAALATTDLPPANPQAAAVARTCLGVPYVADGTTKAGFDSAGLTKFVYARLGVGLRHDITWQAQHGVNLTRDQLRPGDLVFFSSGLPRVGIYVGHDAMISVSGPGTVVSRSPIDWTAVPTMRRYDARTGWHAVIIAKRYLGVPYVFGGAGPSGFDASGFTMWVYAQLGVKLSHGATAQQRDSKPIPLSKLRRGDLVFFGSSRYSYHVAIYMGNGTVIHAPHTGAVVEFGPVGGAWIGGRLLPTR